MDKIKKMLLLLTILMHIYLEAAEIAQSSASTEQKKIQSIPRSKLKIEKSNDLNKLNLSGLKLTDIEGIDTLKVTFNRIKTPLKNVPKLLLDLSNNNLRVLPDSIVKLTGLSMLDLSNNKLLAIPDSINIPNLKILFDRALKKSASPIEKKQLDYPKPLSTKSPETRLHWYDLPRENDWKIPIERLEIEGFYINKLNLSALGLTNIEGIENLTVIFKGEKKQLSEVPLLSLNLIENKLVTIPESIDKLPQLVHLELSKNKLTKLPESIGNLHELRGINMINNSINKLPESIGNLTNLTRLDCPFNKIETLPDTIGNLTNLKTINLRNNNLTVLPDTICKLDQLESLDLENNQLIELPDIIGNLTELKQLSLNNNNLIKLPDTIGNLNKLTILNISHNKLAALPYSICDLLSLESIYLSNNELKSLPNCIGDLPRLQSISLFNNNITALPTSIINNNKIMEHIRIWRSW